MSNIKISVDLEVRGDQYIVVLNGEGMEPVRHVFSSEAEARAAMKRAFETATKIPEVKRVDTDTEGNAFLSGASIQSLMESRQAKGAATFTCPKCGAVSYNPNDIREGYCGRCHEFTGEKSHA